MNFSRAILLVAVLAAAVLGGVFFLRQPRRAATEKPVKENPVPVATSAMSGEKPAPAAQQKKPDVFFLTEDTGKPMAPKARKSAYKQPVVNGTRRIASPKAVTTKQEGTFIHPRWSPDGLELLFSKPGYNGLYKKGVNGGSLTQVTDRDGVGFWAKYNEKGEIETRTNSGETQAFKSDGTPVDSAVMEQDTSIVGSYTKDDTVWVRANPGEAAKPISAGEDRYYGGVLSPDGKHIVYNGLQTGLYIQPVDGSTPPINIGEGYSPEWLPDGSGIVYFIAQDDGHNLTGSDLYLSTRDGTNISNLTQTPEQIKTHPSVSPDGSKIAYEQEGVVYVAELH